MPPKAQDSTWTLLPSYVAFLTLSTTASAMPFMAGIIAGLSRSPVSSLATLIGISLLSSLAILHLNPLLTDFLDLSTV